MGKDKSIGEDESTREDEQQYRPGKKCPGWMGADHCVDCPGCKFSEPPLNTKK